MYKKNILGIFVLLLLSFGFLYFKNIEQGFIKVKSEILEKDGKAYLYKIKDREKTGEEKFWFVATNKVLENQEKISENIFWDPEHCAQMLTLTVGVEIYFFESRFKENSTKEFYDVIYKFDTKKNLMQTFENQNHVNIYSVIYEDEKILVFYEDNGEFYKAELLEKENSFFYENKKIVKEEEMVFKEWKGNINDLDKIKDLKYFIIQ